jgi:hypothetical protein
MQQHYHRETGRVARVKAAPRMTSDERAKAIQDFIDAGLVTHITTADVIAHHDEINSKRSLVPGATRRNTKQ